MIRTLFWEQSDNWEKVLQILQHQNICDIKIWVGKNNKCTHDIHSFDYATFERKNYYGIGRHIYNSVYKYLHVFMDMYSRNYSPAEQNKYSKKTIHDMQNIFNILFDYFVHLLISNKIELVMMSRLPHLGADYLMCRIAEALGIKLLIFYQSLFPNKFFFVFNLDDFGEFKNVPILRPVKPFPIENKYGKDLFYMDKTDFHKNPHILKIRNFFDHNFSLGDKYIYFPLHLQPEMTTSNLGGIYNDQILAIERISKLIPEEWFVYVKENPQQTEFMRGPWFYKRLSAIRNVKVVPIETSTYSLIGDSQFVAVITGTAGWEAISGGKNVLVFGKPWYKTLPGVFSYEDNFSIDEILHYRIDHTELENKLGRLISKSGDGVTYTGYEKIVPDFDPDNNAITLAESIRKILHFAFADRLGGTSEPNQIEKSPVLMENPQDIGSDLKETYQTDWLASDPIFYNEKTGAVSKNINEVIDFGNLEFHPEGLNNYLEFGYSVFEQTPIKNIKFLRHSSKLIQYDNGTLGIEYLEDPVIQLLDRSTHEDDILNLLWKTINGWEQSVQGDIVIPTSGGYDSRLLNLLIEDKSRIRSFTYGLSDNQDESFEVVYARQLSKSIGSNCTWITLGNYHNFFDQWDQIYGISTHAHGMYQMEFYTKILVE